MSEESKRIFDHYTGSVSGITARDERGVRSSLSVRTGNNPGLTVLGCESGCGKTTFMTGLTAIMRQQGLGARAVKPVCIGPRERSEAELAFISSITATPRTYPAALIQSARGFLQSHWSQAISICLNADTITMVETPASLASAMSVEATDAGGLVRDWRDSTDFAVELHFPVVIVAKHNEEAVERLILAWSYARSRGLSVAGLVTVETANNQGLQLESRLTRSEVDLLLQSRTAVPYLGCLKYSPSISVPRVNQGNLVKMTENGCDLLPLFQSIDALVAKK